MVYRHTTWLFNSAPLESWDEEVKISMTELDASHADASRRYAPHFAALGRRALVENSLDGMQSAKDKENPAVNGRANFASATGDTSIPTS